MSKPTIRIESMTLVDDPREPGVIGAIWYEVEYGDGSITPLRQPFNDTGKSQVPKRHVWKRDSGSIENMDLTLSPSFLARWTEKGVPMVVHLFLRNGHIDLLNDSTVVLKP